MGIIPTLFLPKPTYLLTESKFLSGDLGRVIKPFLKADRVRIKLDQVQDSQYLTPAERNAAKETYKAVHEIAHSHLIQGIHSLRTLKDEELEVIPSYKPEPMDQKSFAIFLHFSRTLYLERAEESSSSAHFMKELNAKALEHLYKNREGKGASPIALPGKVEIPEPIEKQAPILSSETVEQETKPCLFPSFTSWY